MFNSFLTWHFEKHACYHFEDINTQQIYISCCIFSLTAVNCGTLTNPANGQVNHTAGTTFGQRAAYTCDVGYNLVGENTRTCQAGGVWSGNAPTCQGEL